MELPEGRPAGKDIEVTYSYDDNNMMHCSFKDVETGKLLEVEINASENATEKSDEIEKFFGGLNGSNFCHYRSSFCVCDIFLQS